VFVLSHFDLSRLGGKVMRKKRSGRLGKRPGDFSFIYLEKKLSGARRGKDREEK